MGKYFNTFVEQIRTDKAEKEIDVDWAWLTKKTLKVSNRFDLFMRAFIENTSIEELSIHNYPLLESDTLRIERMLLEKSKPLKALRFYYLGGSPDEADSFIVEIMRFLCGKNPPLKEFELGDPQAGDKAAFAIADFLKKDGTALRVLSIGKNRFSIEGKQAIVTALRRNFSLLELHWGPYSKEGIDGQLAAERHRLIRRNNIISDMVESRTKRLEVALWGSNLFLRKFPTFPRGKLLHEVMDLSSSLERSSPSP